LFKGLSNLANLGSILKQAQEVGGKLQGINESLKGRRVTGTAGGGLVTVEASGLGEIISCRIDPSLDVAGDREVLEDLLPAAINQAIAKSKEMHAEAMQSLTQGFDLPGLNEMMGQLGGK
jgi:nucleoid-associated protein EbfC